MFSNLRSLILKLDPETAHSLAIKSLKFNFVPNIMLEDINNPLFQTKLFNKDLNIPFQPVFRIGSTYQPAEYTFLRASYGQGYRFPSIAEKYISTFVGGLNIFPNNNIQPEYGWSAEIGLKQGFKINNFKGYLDLSGFVTRYQDMIEFVFDFYNTDGSDITNQELQNILIANNFDFGVFIKSFNV